MAMILGLNLLGRFRLETAIFPLISIILCLVLNLRTLAMTTNLIFGSIGDTRPQVDLLWINLLGIFRTTLLTLKVADQCLGSQGYDNKEETLKRRHRVICQRLGRTGEFCSGP